MGHGAVWPSLLPRTFAPGPGLSPHWLNPHRKMEEEMSRLFPSPAWSPQRPTGARAAPSQSPLEAQEADRLFRVHSTDFGRAAVGRGCGGRGRGLACHTGHLCHDHAPPVQSPGGAPCCRPPGVATAVALAVGAGRWPLAAGQRRPRPQPGASLRGESSRDSADSESWTER